MPRIHPTDGRIVQGTVAVSVNGVVPAALSAITGGSPNWLDAPDSEVVYQNDTATPFLQSIDLDTSALTTQSAGVGANELTAGGLVWTAFLAAGVNAGVRTNVTGFGPFPLAGPGDVDSAGRVAFIQNYAAGRGMQGYSAAGALVWTEDTQLRAGYVVRANTNLVVWPEALNVWQMRRLSTGAVVALALRTEAVNLMVPLALASGAIYVLERSERLTIRLASSSNGYVITEEDTYRPDLIELSPGVIRVAYSTTAGEAPTALRVVDLTIGTGGNQTGTTAAGSLVLTAGTTLSAASLPATASAGGTLIHQPRHPIADTKTGWVSVPWQLYFDAVNKGASKPIDLATGTTGVLPPAGGGTGTGTGTSVLNASNVTIGTLPQGVKWTQYDTSLTGTQANLTFLSADFLVCANASALTVTGLAAGVPGQRLVVVATSASVTLPHQDTGSTAANRLLTFNSLPVTIAANNAAFLEYDRTAARWRLLFISGVGDVAKAGYWTPLTAWTPLNLSQIIAQAGYWSPLTNGLPATPELIYDSAGDTVAVWTQTTDGPMLPAFIEDGTGAAIAVWEPTP